MRRWKFQQRMQLRRKRKTFLLELLARFFDFGGAGFLFGF
jgi:hypothetical protein